MLVITLPGMILICSHAYIRYITADRRAAISTILAQNLIEKCFLSSFPPLQQISMHSKLFLFVGIKSCFSVWYYWCKSKPGGIGFVFFSWAIGHNTLCCNIRRHRAAHTCSSTYEWEVLSECWQPRGQICLSEHNFNCSPVLANWELALTAVGKPSICWIPQIPAQP